MQRRASSRYGAGNAAVGQTSRQAWQVPQESGLGVVRRQFERGEDRAEKQPRAELARNQIGVLALPAEPGGCRERLLHHRRGVDEHFHVAARLRDQPARELLQPRLDDLVIVARPGHRPRSRRGRGVRGSPADRGPGRSSSPSMMTERTSGHSARGSPRRSAVGCHPDPCRHGRRRRGMLEPRLRLRRGVGPRDADHVEAARARGLEQRCLDRWRDRSEVEVGVGSAPAPGPATSRPGSGGTTGATSPARTSSSTPRLRSMAHRPGNPPPTDARRRQGRRGSSGRRPANRGCAPAIRYRRDDSGH